MRGARTFSSGATRDRSWPMGAEIWSSFRHQNHKINHYKTQKMKHFFKVRNSRFAKNTKREKIACVLRALCKMLCVLLVFAGGVRKFCDFKPTITQDSHANWRLRSRWKHLKPLLNPPLRPTLTEADILSV